MRGMLPIRQQLELLLLLASINSKKTKKKKKKTLSLAKKIQKIMAGIYIMVIIRGTKKETKIERPLIKLIQF